MKKIIFFLLALSIISCKETKKESPVVSETEFEVQEENSIGRQIAEAHGFNNFENVEEINFTFNVKVGDSLRTSRAWNWNTKTDEIRLTEADISRTYKKDGDISEEEKEVDQKFINDSYWLLFPFQLVWSDAEISEVKKAKAPISQTEMNYVEVSYKNEGGYTPGDTYVIYFEKDLLLKEWIYKSADGNREMPTTWEDFKDYKGLKIARSHKSPDGSFELFFSNIEVK
ncbi:hypothetical protein ACW6QP_10960 [Salegentibacter sp. HM20]